MQQASHLPSRQIWACFHLFLLSIRTMLEFAQEAASGRRTEESVARKGKGMWGMPVDNRPVTIHRTSGHRNRTKRDANSQREPFAASYGCSSPKVQMGQPPVRWFGRAGARLVGQFYLLTLQPRARCTRRLAYPLSTTCR